MNLTTRSKYKAFIGAKQNDQSLNGVLDVVIPAVSELVANKLGRDMETQTYKLWVDGNGKQKFPLPQWPITRIYEVSTSTQTLIRVTFSGGSRANIGCDGTSVNLFSVATDGATTDTAIALADYPTVTELSDQITTISGWTGTVQNDQGSEYSVLVKPFATKWVKDDEIDLDGPDEAGDVRIVAQTNRLIESMTGGVFPLGRQNIWVWYIAGYTLPTDGQLNSGNIPDGLELSLLQILKDVMDLAKRDETLKKEKIGNYEYTVSDAIQGGQSTLTGAVDKRWADLVQYRTKLV